MNPLPHRHRWSLSALENRWRIVLAVVCIIAAVAALALAAPDATNCGGNSAALGMVHGIAGIARMELLQNPSAGFRFNAPPENLRPDLAELSHFRGLSKARFLVTTSPITARDVEQRRLIVVCDRTYRNVPQRWFGLKAPPTHAAGFADGSTGLLSEAEFAALDRSTFVPLDELFPPKTK